MNETNRETLQASLQRLQSEQNELRSQLADLQAQLSTVNAERQAAQRRYDSGYDEAAGEVRTLTERRNGLETAIAQAERDLSEYPERIHHVNQQIERLRYRDGLRELLQLRREEAAAFNLYEQLVIDFVTSYGDFWAVHQQRKTLAYSLEALGRQLREPQFDHGNVGNLPTYIEIDQWLRSGNPAQRADEAFSRARTQFVAVAD